jgi:putative methyltransferase (TIGR04325 family)
MLSRLIPVLADGAARVPLIRPLLRRWHWRRFSSVTGHTRLFHGIYPDFASALRAIPPGRLVGYDNEASAERLADERLRIVPLDYPVLFWLQKLLPEARLLFDFGGHVGISYFGFRKYLQYPPALTWLVMDVPAIVAAGERIARSESARQLLFTTDLDQLPQADILLAAGSLHFVENPFQILGSVPALPKHVLLNKVPLRDLPAAVTLHNMGSAMCPYHLFNRAEFLAGFESLGYTLRDEWTNPDLGAHIPLYREHSVPAFSGFYFERRRPT